jgi:hypothetical protein
MADQVAAAAIVGKEKAEEEEKLKPLKVSFSTHIHTRDEAKIAHVCDYPVEDARDVPVKVHWDHLKAEFTMLGRNLGDKLFSDANTIGTVVSAIASFIGQTTAIVADKAGMILTDVIKDIPFIATIFMAAEELNKEDGSSPNEAASAFNHIIDGVEEMQTPMRVLSEICHQASPLKYKSWAKKFALTLSLFLNFKEWYNCYRNGRDIVHAELVIMWVPDREQEQYEGFVSHYNLSDKPLPSEYIMHAKFGVQITIINPKTGESAVDYFIDPRATRLQHLGMPGCGHVMATLESLDQFRVFHISQAAFANILSWRCNKTTPVEDRVNRVRSAINTLPNSTYLDAELLKGHRIIEDTNTFIAMYIMGDPWATLDTQVYLN